MPHERARILYKVADIIEARVDELSKLQTRDNGKPLTETRGLVMSAAATARYVAAACETLNDELTTQRALDFMTMSVHEPVGVVAAITLGTLQLRVKFKSLLQLWQQEMP